MSKFQTTCQTVSFKFKTLDFCKRVKVNKYDVPNAFQLMRTDIMQLTNINVYAWESIIVELS